MDSLPLLILLLSLPLRDKVDPLAGDLFSLPPRNPRETAPLAEVRLVRPAEHLLLHQTRTVFPSNFLFLVLKVWRHVSDLSGHRVSRTTLVLVPPHGPGSRRRNALDLLIPRALWVLARAQPMVVVHLPSP
ncbi:hypothetical protein EDC04DRAFT_2663731 [Pisolithus marmoratus]|nr:hypothetical protein EDC04DRAFT_2663731 [Pisolithus marmoratus]